MNHAHNRHERRTEKALLAKLEAPTDRAGGASPALRHRLLSAEQALALYKLFVPQAFGQNLLRKEK